MGGRGRADGGVDLVLVRNGETTVVQVKHWRRDVVGVSLVRELYGVQSRERGHKRDLRRHGQVYFRRHRVRRPSGHEARRRAWNCSASSAPASPGHAV